MLLAFAIMVTILQADPAREPQERAIRRCGAEPVTLAWESDFQGYVSQLEQPVDDRALACLANTPGLGDVFFDLPQEQSEAYRRALASRPDIAAALAAVRVESRQWLETRGLLERLPVYTQGQPLKPFADAVEALCELPPGSLVADDATSTLTLQSVGIEIEQAQCWMKVLMASDLEAQGVRAMMTVNAADGVATASPP